MTSVLPGIGFPLLYSTHHEEHEAHEGSETDIFEFLNFVLFATFVENCGYGQEMRLPRESPPNVLIGGPVRIPPGFPLKACGNDGLVGELGVEGYAPFAFSMGERKIMNHFVVYDVPQLSSGS
jgi:hypothetical protein